jgi:hypothetical protein
MPLLNTPVPGHPSSSRVRRVEAKPVRHPALSAQAPAAQPAALPRLDTSHPAHSRSRPHLSSAELTREAEASQSASSGAPAAASPRGTCAWSHAQEARARTSLKRSAEPCKLRLKQRSPHVSRHAYAVAKVRSGLDHSRPGQGLRGASRQRRWRGLRCPHAPHVSHELRSFPSCPRLLAGRLQLMPVPAASPLAHVFPARPSRPRTCFASTPTNSTCATCEARTGSCASAHPDRYQHTRTRLPCPTTPARRAGPPSAARRHRPHCTPRPPLTWRSAASASAVCCSAGTAVGSASGALTGRGPGEPGPRSAKRTMAWLLPTCSAHAATAHPQAQIR